MPKQTINVGTPPGDLGDGDTLRDAFIKTNSNFDELYTVYPVTDTTLDHDDPNVAGSIAKALLDAGNAGGGLVLVGAGTFTCPSTTLTIPENVILRGVGRRATTILVTGSQDGISLLGRFTGVETLKLQMPTFVSGNGIRIRANYSHLRDLMISGVSPNSWGINVDSSNVCKIDNVALGIIVNGGPDAFTGNGIVFQITDPTTFPFNYGDSNLVKVDITLSSGNTTGIKFHGPDDTKHVINNVLMSQVEVIGTGQGGGCTGIHLRNSARITCNQVDLENLDTAILEESVGAGSNRSSNNVYISTFVFGTTTSYRSTGEVNRRLFLGCDNLIPESLSDSDVMLPRAIWLNETTCRMWGPIDGQLAVDDGDNTNGLRITVNSESPAITPSSSSATAMITLGRLDSQGVSCLPGIVLAANTSPLAAAVDGTLAQFTAGVVGPNGGLYQLRDSNWVFIG